MSLLDWIQNNYGFLIFIVTIVGQAYFLYFELKQTKEATKEHRKRIEMLEKNVANKISEKDMESLKKMYDDKFKELNNNMSQSLTQTAIVMTKLEGIVEKQNQWGETLKSLTQRLDHFMDTLYIKRNKDRTDEA